MRLKLSTSVAFLLMVATAGRAAPTISLELASEREVQITAPHEWMQLLTTIGIDDVRIRGMQPGDELKVVNRGTSERPRYHLLGILTSRDQLQLPGGSFSRGDRSALIDYFDRLGADGAEALTARHGRFGLTAKELISITADLAQPIDFETKGQQPLGVIGRLLSRFDNEFVMEAAANRALSSAGPVAAELRGLTAGTALAMMLRDAGCALNPEKQRGQPLAHRVALAKALSLAADTIGRADDNDLTYWPIGWKPEQTPGRTAPELFEPRNAEIDGYTLEETLSAIGSRIKIPFYFDHAALRAEQIDPASLQVRLERTRTTYKRIIDRVLAQSRLHSQIRVDEAGTPFLWITR